MPGVDPGALSGESAKEVWLPHVMEDRQREEHERFAKQMPPLPKGMKAMPFKPHVPWTSLGQAPTAEQLEDNDYSGVA